MWRVQLRFADSVDAPATFGAGALYCRATVLQFSLLRINDLSFASAFYTVRFNHSKIAD